jgi:hypothetical protein
MLGMGWVIVDARVNSAKQSRDETAKQELLLAFGLSLKDLEKNQDLACQIIQAQLGDLKDQADLIWGKIPTEAKVDSANQPKEIERQIEIRDALTKKLVAARDVRAKYTTCQP